MKRYTNSDLRHMLFMLIEEVDGDKTGCTRFYAEDANVQMEYEDALRLAKKHREEADLAERVRAFIRDLQEGP